MFTLAKTFYSSKKVKQFEMLNNLTPVTEYLSQNFKLSNKKNVSKVCDIFIFIYFVLSESCVFSQPRSQMQLQES